jgi:hypothetical protein
MLAAIKAARGIEGPCFSTTEVDMTNTNPQDLSGMLRTQHEALLELIDITLTGIRESGDSSVGAIHLTTRLSKLADSLKRTANPTLRTSPPPMRP